MKTLLTLGVIAVLSFISTVNIGSDQGKKHSKKSLEQKLSEEKRFVSKLRNNYDTISSSLNLLQIK